MAFLFIVWIPTGKYEECQKNNRIWGFEEIDINKISSDSEDDDLKKSKPISSADTFAISIESVSSQIDKEITKDSPLITRTKSEDCVSSAEQPIPQKTTFLKRSSDSTDSFNELINKRAQQNQEAADKFFNSSLKKQLNQHSSMEHVMNEVIEKMKIKNASWVSTNRGNSYQVTFSLDSSRVDDTIHFLSEWGIGQREGSSISIIPCTLYYDQTNHEDTDDELKSRVSLTTKETAWNKFISSVRARLNVAKIVKTVKSDATLTFDFLSLLIVASILAAFGLVEDSTLFLAASMLISPLMGPIIAATFGTVIKDTKLGILGVTNELIGIFMATFVGFIFGFLFCSIDSRYAVGQGISQEMYSRCNTHALIVGILIALPSGAAVAIAILGENVGSLVGVAISASLLPPAVNAGLLWALSCVYMTFRSDGTKFNTLIKTSLFSEHQSVELAVMGLISMCVTLTNCVCIYLMGVTFLKIKEVAPLSTSDEQRQFWKHDIKIARDYNKTLHTEDGTSLNKKLAEEIAIFNEHETEKLHSGAGADLLKHHNHQSTWSPMTRQYYRRESCPGRTSMYDLDALYLSLTSGPSSQDRHRYYGLGNITKTCGTSPTHKLIPDEFNAYLNKQTVPIDTHYTSTVHAHDYLKSSSAPLEQIAEFRGPLPMDSKNSLVTIDSSLPSEFDVLAAGPSSGIRKFIVTPSAHDPLKK